MFVILGATGKAGRTTIKQLRSQGAPVRAVLSDLENAMAIARERRGELNKGKFRHAKP